MEKETFQIIEPFLENLSRVRLITNQIIIYIYIEVITNSSFIEASYAYAFMCIYVRT